MSEQKPKIQESPEWSGEGFDLRTHVRDANTGRILKLQPYRMKIKDGVETFERPVGSGNLWFRDGSAANEHKAFAAPVTEAQTVNAQREQIAELQKELAAVKGDRAPKKNTQAAEPK